MADRDEGYRFLEHTTDAYIEAWAPTLEGAFSHAAEGLFATMLDLDKIDPSQDESALAEGHDEQELLYNWLEDLLLRFEINGKVFSKFQVNRISREAGSYRLQARILGEKYIRSKHGSKTEVKGITYHLMEIETKLNRAIVRFLLDL